jgi:hypothetical protein
MKGQEPRPWWTTLLWVLLTACSGPGVSGRSAPGRYAQTTDSATSACLRNPACYTQVGDDAVLPWLARAASRAGSAAAVLRFLEATEIARVEYVLMECAKEANFKVNERVFGQGKRPGRAQCEEVLRRGAQDKPVTRAMELGREKHQVALECAQRELSQIVSGNFSLEPRYLYDVKTGRVRLLDAEEVARWLRDGQFYLLIGTLVPDVVLHASGNALKVQAVYDFKFPCPGDREPEWYEYPPQHPFTERSQGELYREALKGSLRPARVSPGFGISR